jgi:hypothetical protein
MEKYTRESLDNIFNDFENDGQLTDDNISKINNTILQLYPSANVSIIVDTPRQCSSKPVLIYDDISVKGFNTYLSVRFNSTREILNYILERKRPSDDID